MRFLCGLATAASLFGIAGIANAQQPNPIVEAYGSDLRIASMTVQFDPGVSPPQQDRLARSFIDGEMSASQREDFESWASSKVCGGDQTAECLGAYFVERLYQKRFESPRGGRPVNVEVRVDQSTSFSTFRALAYRGYPKASVVVTIRDLDGRLLASSRVAGINSSHGEVSALDFLEIENRNLRNDTNFRMFVLASDSIASHVDAVVHAPRFLTGRYQMGQYSGVPFMYDHAVFDVTIAPQ